tara:strand:- start:1869 stop:2201 length:333 start_codon:yes stop_codon:yes gene_type:complete
MILVDSYSKTLSIAISLLAWALRHWAEVTVSKKSWTKEWTDADKAEWILKNGWSGKTATIFERVGEQVYVRPIPQDGETLPPWLSRERRPLSKGEKVPSRQENDYGKKEN